MPRGDLFPDIAPYETGLLPLSGGHVMYWEQVGNPRGQPVLFLHGGPGAGAGAVHRRFFDPAHWRVVIFDQRGAGRSRPLGELRDIAKEVAEKNGCAFADVYGTMVDAMTKAKAKYGEKYHVAGGDGVHPAANG